MNTKMNFEDLSTYRIPGHETFYVPDFVTKEEEEYLLRKISETPQQRWKKLANRRLQLWGGEITSNILFSQPMPPVLNVYPDLISRLRNIGIFASSPHGAPNHIILNEYLPGQGIMPHEDGPAYHPVVATISLGSHSVFHYYQYNTADTSMDNPSLHSRERGRTIDPNPILSVVLERRSLVISRGTMYTSHLHGIQEISEDCVSASNCTSPPMITDLGVKVANWKMLTGEEVRRVMEHGGVLKRGIRYSLTCRDVERVSCVKSLIR